MRPVPPPISNGRRASLLYASSRSLVLIALVLATISGCSSVGPFEYSATHAASTPSELIAQPHLTRALASSVPTVTGHPPHGLASLPAGEYLLVIRSEGRSNPQGEEWLSLFAMDLDGQVGPVIATDIGADVALSGDESLLAFFSKVSAASGAYELVIVDLHSGDRIQSIPSFNGARHPSWSPDSSRLVLESGGNLSVLTLADRRVETVLPCNGVPGAGCVGPRWSSDGSYIAYGYDLSRSGPPDPVEGLYILDTECLAGQPQCDLETAGPISPPTGPWEWSPDGHLLAIGSYDGSIAIRSARTWSLQRRLVTSEGLDVNSLAWSPDGEWIAAELGPDGRISRISVSSGEEIPIYEGGNMRRLVGWISIGRVP